MLRGGLAQPGGDAAVLRTAITEPAGVDTAGVDANTQFLLDLLDNKGEAATLHAVCAHQCGDCVGGILWVTPGLWVASVGCLSPATDCLLTKVASNPYSLCSRRQYVGHLLAFGLAIFVVLYCLAPQFVNPACGADNLRMRHSKGALDRAGRAVVVAALYHSGTVTLARLAARSLTANASAWTNVRAHGCVAASSFGVVCTEMRPSSPSFVVASAASSHLFVVWMWCRPYVAVVFRLQAPGGAAGSASGAQPAPFLFHAWDAGFRSRRFMCSRYDKDVETKSYPVLSHMLTAEVAHLLEFAPAVSHTLSSSRAGAVLAPGWCRAGVARGVLYVPSIWMRCHTDHSPHCSYPPPTHHIVSPFPTIWMRSHSRSFPTL